MELLNQNTNNSGSLVEVTSSILDFNVKGDSRLMEVLYRDLEEMKKKVHALETEKVLQETQLPPELLLQNGLLPKPISRIKVGRGYRPLLKSEIEEAQQHEIFARGQARYLGVSFSNLKKYSKLYGIYKPNPNIKGKKQLRADPTRGKYPLIKVLTGEYNGNLSITNAIVRHKLIKGGIFPAECKQCGYNKIRLDGKMALLLDHMDGDQKNFKQDNLQLLCYNCMFECGRGYIRRGNYMFDPDWLEGQRKYDLTR